MWPPIGLPKTAYIQSTDLDVTLSQLPKEALVIDISEVSSAELLKKLDGQFDDKTLSFSFNEQEGALLNALKEKRTVVLKGQVKEEVRHVLSEFLLQRQREESPKGHLIIMSDLPHLFPMVSSFSPYSEP